MLLDAIVDNQLKDRRFDNENTSHIPFTYQIMKRAAKSRLYKPCVKRYLFRGRGDAKESGLLKGRGVTTTFLQIPGEDWNKVLFMPWERFHSMRGGASKTQVWTDSMKRR